MTTMSRRNFVWAGVATMMGAEFGVGRALAAGVAQSAVRSTVEFTAVKALVFDTFGTVVDWRTSVSQEVAQLATKKGLKVDAEKFAEAWRAGYGPSMNRVRTGELPWTKLDVLHRTILDKILVDFGMKGLSEDEISTLNHAWHRLHPWPDSVSGLTRLKKRYIIAPLSNGNISLMTDLAKFAGLPWDCIITAENARRYKPAPEVYRTAVALLGLPAGQVMLVAAHNYDLRAARSEGWHTAFVPRPTEYGPGQTTDLAPEEAWDVVARDFVDLAEKLGA